MLGFEDYINKHYNGIVVRYVCLGLLAEGNFKYDITYEDIAVKSNKKCPGVYMEHMIQLCRHTSHHQHLAYETRRV